MNYCKRCFRPLEQVGNLRRAAFPEGRWWDSQLVDRRYTLLQCPECKELTFLIERLDADKKIVDWHYLTSVGYVKRPRS